MSGIKMICITGCMASFLVACADWQTTPITVDKHHGMAVRHMIAQQTLYPEHSRKHRQVLLIDGAKGEGIVRAYRAPATDLRQGKKQLQVDIGDR